DAARRSVQASTSTPACGVRQRNYRAADGLTALHCVERGGKLANLHLLADDRAQLARGEQGQKFGMQPFSVAMCREVESTRALEHDRVIDVRVAHADEREVPEQHWSRHQSLVFLFDARREPGEYVAAVERHAPERLRCHVAAHRIECDVDTPAGSRIEYGFGEIRFPVVDRDLGTEFEAQSRL